MADLLRGVVLASCFLLPFVFARWFATLWPSPDEVDPRDERAGAPPKPRR